MSSKKTITGIWLRETFARIQPNPILEYDGPKEVNNITELSANYTVRGDVPLPETNPTITGSKHFLIGTDLFGYIYRYYETLQDHVITIVIPSLRSLYWNNKDQLPEDLQIDVDSAMTSLPPTFYNIYDYKSLTQYGDQVNVAEYQLIGSITPYDVVHFSILEFVNHIMQKQPLRRELPINTILEFVFDDADFWDDQFQKILTVTE